MFESLFKTWLKAHPNLLTSKTPSFILDRAIAKPGIQTSIRKSASNQLIYAYLEDSIARHYTVIVDLKLRQIRSQFTEEDLKASKGFSLDEEKSSVQKRYFRRYEVLTYFIKYDITKHVSECDAKVNALRRWISIADKLFEKKNFEGTFLVLTAISDIAKPGLVGSLPAHYQQRYTDLSNIFSPLSNFKALREHISSINDASVLVPLSIYSKDVTRLEEVLKGEMSIDGRQASHAHLKRMTDSFQALSLFVKPLSEHQKQTYRQMTKIVPRVHPQDSVRNLYALTPRNREPGSNLFSHHLVPSFWRRGGKSLDVMWAKTLPLSNSAAYTE